MTSAARAVPSDSRLFGLVGDEMQKAKLTLEIRQQRLRELLAGLDGGE